MHMCIAFCIHVRNIRKCLLCSWYNLCVCLYAGRGAKGTGRHTRKGIPCLCDVLVCVHECRWLSGGFIVNQHKIPEIVVPNLEGFEVSLILTPYTQYLYGHASICTTFSLNYHFVCVVLQLKHEALCVIQDARDQSKAHHSSRHFGCSETRNCK